MIDAFFTPLAAGFASIANFWTLLYIVIGVAVGYAVGAIPVQFKAASNER